MRVEGKRTDKKLNYILLVLSPGAPRKGFHPLFWGRRFFGAGLSVAAPVAKRGGALAKRGGALV